jgi:hypothetical protein
MKDLVDKLLEKMTEAEIRTLCEPHKSGSWINFACPAILAELDRRKRERLPWWRRIFK